MEYKDAANLFKYINIELLEDKFLALKKYQELLMEWNEKINLTAITEDQDVWIKHFVDSCTISKYIETNSSVIDVGTGAGFPSIPLKIIDESLKLTLLDSLNKRINFLMEVSNELKLKNLECVHGRAEDIANDAKYREKFDIATARAVANLSTLAEYCLPFVKVGGKFICMKGSNAKQEIEESKKAIEVLGGKIVDVVEINLPVIDDGRTIIVIEKKSRTSKNYPRKAGLPSKEPIK